MRASLDGLKGLDQSPTLNHAYALDKLVESQLGSQPEAKHILTLRDAFGGKARLDRVCAFLVAVLTPATAHDVHRMSGLSLEDAARALQALVAANWLDSQGDTFNLTHAGAAIAGKLFPGDTLPATSADAISAGLIDEHRRNIGENRKCLVTRVIAFGLAALVVAWVVGELLSPTPF